jgi:single-stranded DNA-specific DHH superfamily exonuclease
MGKDMLAEHRFRAALSGMNVDQPILVLCHNDADGLAAGALLARGLRQIRPDVTIRLVGRGESPCHPPSCKSCTCGCRWAHCS